MGARLRRWFAVDRNSRCQQACWQKSVFFLTPGCDFALAAKSPSPAVAAGKGLTRHQECIDYD